MNKSRNIFIIHFLIIINISAQPGLAVQSDGEKYRLLLDQVNLYIDYYPLDDDMRQLYDQAKSYGDNNEYEIAVIYLEEILSTIGSSSKKEESLPNPEISEIKIRESPVKFSAISGIDFNRQEFEIGYLQNDSTILEEFSKPYIGLAMEYGLKNDDGVRLRVTNSLRYDKENWRDYYRVRWNAAKFTSFQYNGFLNYSKTYPANSFWEHEVISRYMPVKKRKISWSINNTFNYKNYRHSDGGFFNYYQNRFELINKWGGFNRYIIQSHYQNIFYEHLGGENLDFIQHEIEIGYRKTTYYTYWHALDLDIALRNYSLEFEDSLFSNSYSQVKSELIFSFPLWQDGRIELNDHLLLKSYKEKSSLEPDYIWNYFRPLLLQKISQSTEAGFGYELEIKRHREYQDDVNSISDQDYTANGIFSSLNYFSLSGTYLTLYLSYQWRRYPESITNEMLSIYSDRNVLSLFIMAYIPFTRNISVNILTTYDNDKDIDIDQRNNQSVIISAELEYKLK